MKKYKDFIPHSDDELRVYSVSYRHNFKKMAQDAIPHLNNAAVARKKELMQATTTKIRQMAMYTKKGYAGTSHVVSGGILPDVCGRKRRIAIIAGE